MKKNCTEEDKNQRRSKKIQKKRRGRKKNNNKVIQKRSVSKGSKENFHCHRKMQKEKMKTDFFRKKRKPFLPQRKLNQMETRRKHFLGFCKGFLYIFFNLPW